MTPLTPEMIERAARAIHDLMGPYLGTPEQIAKHGDRVAARQLETAEKYATVALTAALSCPDGFRLVPVEPTTGMLSAGESAASVGIGKCNDDESLPRVWRAMLAASPAPAVDNAGWRPIASFPKDGELYLVCDDRSLDGDHQVVFWDEDLETPFKLHTPDGPAFHEAAFTHWQPLPSAPSQDAPPPRSLSNKD